MSSHRNLRDSELVISDNRLFLIVWSDPDSCKSDPLPAPDSNCPNSESLFQTNQDYPETLFEMYEILISENGRKPVVQLTSAQLEEVFQIRGNSAVQYTYGFPCFDSNGRCNSVVLLNYYTSS